MRPSRNGWPRSNGGRLVNRHARCCPSMRAFTAGLLVGLVALFAVEAALWIAAGLRGEWR